MEVNRKMRPIYATNGEWVALLVENGLYDTTGDWIGWLEPADAAVANPNDARRWAVYNRDGIYVGFLAPDGRVLRERIRPRRPQQSPPAFSPKIRPPASVPLAPMFAELPWNQVDVFEEEPEVFRFISELRPDWE